MRQCHRNRFTVGTERVPPKEKGYGSTTKVHILSDGAKIGEYARNYQDFGAQTFCPFLQDGKWYALYSSDYTATRVMWLSSSRRNKPGSIRTPRWGDLCGEEPDSFGFCPVDYFVPFGEDYKDIKWEDKEGKEHIIKTSQINGKIGFVAGCVWGDDSSWKIQVLDLSNIAKGEFKRDDRFGYIELPEGMRLKDAIVLRHYDEEEPFVQIPVQHTFDLHTGKEYH